MKRFILYYFIAFTLLSCGNPQGQFRLTGEFEHLQQGEFYLYCPEQGQISFDTIKLTNGKFEYQRELQEEVTFYLLYPNFTEQVIFAKGGTNIKIKGDAQKLTETEVLGTKDNELLTEFRLKHLKKTLEEQIADATKFIQENPKSQVSKYLFKKYFLDGICTDTTKIIQTYDIISQAQPESPDIIKWKNLVETKSKGININEFKKLNFITAEKDTVTTETFKGKPLLITIWASWLNNSYHNFQTKRLWTKYQDSVQVLSISLDLSMSDLNEGIKRSDILWPVYCNFEGWNNPIIEYLAINEIPYFFLFDEKHKFVLSSNKISEYITPALKKLIHIKEP